MLKWFYAATILAAFLWPVTPTWTSFTPIETFQYTGDGVITILNTHTHEIETIKYKMGPSLYLPEGISEINDILRCRLTNHRAHMSLKLIELVDNIQDHFESARIEVVSGYRSPELNGSLRATGHRVASHSLHMSGLAMDIRIPGVSLHDIRNYALSLKVGGVGFYSGRFVHIDVGPVRQW